ncbi:restriction endonuclease subunit S [Pseudomonas syringae]|uniref:Type I restriction-modification system specificity subunit n=1 Tax=Pseudomonas syringae pv. japonica str. M301072 TaxID=629262 RepID=F3FMD4_PSESX|nr:restriction endonuclease subunit S [Pseudomonas syringae]EGH31370.1 Type I restriction-modification system specificity subunit [Pseudomonas syringae pv. japonica str. M301072]KZL42065.1 hypothetical protein VT47_03140 [Pseudomonas syringae pv. syringae]MBI6819455.1 restriction endonuclease subunit S [Pseudomonas syringae]MBI6824449.1 restriction endonuclease subunit S [Pseudomonas syringae]
MSDWRFVPLGDLIESLDAGVSVNAEDRPHGAGEIGVLKTSAISGGEFHAEQNKAVLQSERRLIAEPVQADSILVSRMNTPALVGESCYVAEAYPMLFLPDRLWQLKPRDRMQVNMRWLSFVLQSADYRSYVEVHATGTSGTMKNLPKSKMLSFPVLYPPLSEQKIIAQILDTLDTIIRETESILDKLKALKHGLLHDLLTRGIDANGELRPSQSEAPQLYKESQWGCIPKEWRQTSTRELCSLITKGTTPAANNMWQGSEGVKFLRVDNLSFDGQLDFDASRFQISLGTHRGELSRSICLPGDVLTNIVGPPLGKLGLVTKQMGEVNINQAIALFRPEPNLLPGFLLLWLGGSPAQTWLRKRAKQTSGQVNLTLALCQELPIPKISLEEQQLIVDRIEKMHERLSVGTSELSKLHHMKYAMMDDLLTGRVRVTPLLEGIAP